MGRGCGQTTGRAWDDTTLQLVFSTTKGAAAICVARLVDAGKLSYEDTVASHWPEFAANGKEHDHRGADVEPPGGPAVRGPALTLDEMLAVGPVVEALAEQTPVWKPGRRTATTRVTYGWLAGELVRRSMDVRSARISPTRSPVRSGSTSGSDSPSRRSRA